MANDRQSLTNYETILWLWDSTDEQRVKFLASLTSDQRGQFCDVLKDVLNNPWEGRSVLKLTKLNKLLGQKIELIKKQVQFSGDRTPELDEVQIFRLFHDYAVLNHDGRTLRLSDLGRKSLRQLLDTVNAEFEAYYNHDPKHPQLLWDGFQNDTQFSVEGMEKTQVEPTDYGELNAKITNYFFPSKGKPRSTDNEPEDEPEDNEEYYNPTPHEGLDPDSIWGLLVKYLPLFVSYLLLAVCADMTGVNGLWSVFAGLFSVFVSVKWYHYFKIFDRAWAALLQGFWILYFLIGIVFAGIDNTLLYAHLVWPIPTFWFLCKELQRDEPKVKRFRVIGTAVLGAMLGFSVFRGQTGYSQINRYQIERELHVVQQQCARQPNLKHYNQIKNTPGGICWRALQPCDVTFLTETDMKTLRLQLSSVLTRNIKGLMVDEISNLSPGKIQDGHQEWVANVRFNAPLYTVHNAYSNMAKDLDLIIDSVKYYTLAHKSGEAVQIRFWATERDFSIMTRSPFEKMPGFELFFGVDFEGLVLEGRTLLIEKGSEFDQTLSALDRVVKKWQAERATDKLIKDADPDAAARYNGNGDLLKRCQRELIRMARMRKPHTESTEELRSLINSGVQFSQSVMQSPTVNKPMSHN